MLPLVAAGLTTAGTALASKMMEGKDNVGQDAIQNALAQYVGIRPPTAEDLKVVLQKMVYQGDLTPDQAQTYMESPSAMSAVSGSPEAKSAQLQSLAQMSGVAQAGGMDPESQAELETVRGQNASVERGSRNAIMQNARERGMGGSGMDLLDEMENEQGSATRGAQEGLDVAAQARARSLQAMADTGQLAGNVEGQTYGEQANKAAAADAITRFNTQNLNSTEQANIAARNAAAARNLDTKQGISNANTEIAGEQSKADASAKQQAFTDQMAKAAGASGQDANLANIQLENEKNKRAFTGTMMGTGGQVLGGYLSGQKASSDETKKKDIADVPAASLEEFMAHLDPKRFKYKDPGAPGANEGENVGVMAQDVEKTPVGRTMVTNTKDGKMLDIQKGFEVMLAAIGALHRKLDDEKEHGNA